MQKYKYKAVTVNKVKYEGVFLAENVDDLRRQLAKQNLYLTSAKIASDKSPNPFFSLTGTVKLTELTSFCRQFSIMINSGISIVDSINILRSQDYTGYFRKILDMIYEDVNGGMLLSNAMKKHPRVFPNFFFNMVYIGEMSGGLDRVLISLADYYETDSKIKRKAVSALSYPLILLVMIVGVMAIMMLFVVPIFRDALEDMDVEMPQITLIIFDFSEFLLNNYTYILLGIFGIVGVFLIASRTQKGKFFIDMLKIKLPFLGKIQTNILTARFARGFGILLDSGMDIVKALDTISLILGNKYIECKFADAVQDVRKGNSLTTAFNKYKIFPDILLQMISIGEKTGSLNEVLLRSCTFFDEEVESALMAFTAVLQPVMLLFMGASIGIVFVAIYSPMLSIMTSVTI